MNKPTIFVLLKSSLTYLFFCLLAYLPHQLAHADSLNAAKKIYNGLGACAACHGAEGKGDGAASAALNPKPRSFTNGTFKFDTDGDGKSGTDIDLLNVITHGAAKYGGSATMVGRSDISEADRKALVKLIRTLKTSE